MDILTYLISYYCLLGLEHHDKAEILLKLAFNANQSIVLGMDIFNYPYIRNILENMLNRTEEKENPNIYLVDRRGHLLVLSGTVV